MIILLSSILLTDFTCVRLDLADDRIYPCVLFYSQCEFPRYQYLSASRSVVSKTSLSP